MGVWGRQLSWGLAVVLSAASAPAARPLVLPVEAFNQDAALIQSRQRIERDESGRILVAPLVFQSGGEPQGQRLPAHLGGGVLFFQPIQAGAETQTALYWGPSWTAPLEPLARIAFLVQRVIPGFDRLYLEGGGDFLAFDGTARKLVGLGNLPTVAHIGALSFGGTASAVLQAPLLGVLETHDAGLTWRRAADADELAPEPGLVLSTETGLMRVLDDGRREPFARAAPPPRARTNDGQRATEALLLGLPQSGGIWAIARERLIRVDLAGGVALQTWPVASVWDSAGVGDAPPLGSCSGLARGVGDVGAAHFLCVGESTRLLALEAGRLRELRRFDRPRRSLASGPLGLLLEGGCEAGAGVCWVGPQQSRTLSASNALAFGVGRTELVRLRRAKDALELEDLRGGRPARRFELPREEELRQLLALGQWLPELVETDDGFVGWVVRGEQFVGVALGAQSTLAVGPVQRQLRRSVFSGRHALIWGAAGYAKETRDGGLTWTEIQLPFASGDPALNQPEAGSELRMGCSPAGCALGRMLRFGWGDSEAEEEPEALEQPERLPIPPPGGGRFRFSCSPDGPWRGAAPSADAVGSRKRPGFVELHADAVDQRARLSATGPSDVGWARQGSAQLTFVEPFSTEPAQQSLATQGLFRDALHAEEALGQLEPTTALVTLASSGEGGLFLVSGRSRQELFGFAAGEPIERIEGATEFGVRRLLGAARLGGEWYSAQRTRDTLTLLLARAGQLVEVASFPMGNWTEGQVELVSSREGQLGLSVDGDAGLFVYPLSSAGALGDAIFVRHQGARPASCSADAGGFTVVRELPIAPYMERSGSPLDVSRVTARYRVGPGWFCLEALRARSRGAGEAPATPMGRAKPVRSSGLSRPVPMTVTDSSGQVQRWRCE